MILLRRKSRKSYNAEETHDESDKGTVAQAVPNDATTDTANDTTQEAVEVSEVLEAGDRVGPTEEKLRLWL